MKAFVRLAVILGVLFAVAFACEPGERKFGTSYVTPTGTGVPFISGSHYAPAAVGGTEGQGLTWSDGGVLWATPAAADAGAAGVTPHNLNGFRLSLTTGVAVTTADVTAAATIYQVPTATGGGQISLYTAGAWEAIVSAQVSLAVTCTLGKNYDLFDADVAGVLTLSQSAAWTNDTTRDSGSSGALGTQDGMTVLASDHSKLWVGTYRCTATNQVEDSISKRDLWNAYNRVTRSLQRYDTTTSWTSAGAVFRSVHADAANAFEYVAGDTTFLTVNATLIGNCNNASSTVLGPGIGIDSTSVNSATVFGTQLTNAHAGETHAVYRGYPAIGWRKINWLELGSTNVTYYGNFGPGNFVSGMLGEILGANDNGVEPTERAA